MKIIPTYSKILQFIDLIEQKAFENYRDADTKNSLKTKVARKHPELATLMATLRKM